MTTDDATASPAAEQELRPAKEPDAPGVLAECQALERRWLALHEDFLRLTPDWQHFLGAVSRGGPAPARGQPLSWTEGALLFGELRTHAARLTAIAEEAVRTCGDYATALQRAVEDSSPAPGPPSGEPPSSPANDVGGAPSVPPIVRS
ncbi:MAG: hypothetical protein NVSMB65_18370 [Chloroflexota bacterium]